MYIKSHYQSSHQFILKYKREGLGLATVSSSIKDIENHLKMRKTFALGHWWDSKNVYNIYSESSCDHYNSKWHSHPTHMAVLAYVQNTGYYIARVTSAFFFCIFFCLKQNSVETIHSDCLVSGEQIALILNSFLFFGNFYYSIKVLLSLQNLM